MLCSGQVYHSTFTVWDQDSQPSGTVLSITKPDGTTVTPAPVPAAWAQSGRDYATSYDYQFPAPGLYRFAWSTTSPGTAPPPEYVSVRDFISLLSTAEARAHLNITRASADYDAELQRFMQAATELVESKVGLCVRRDFTDRVTGGPRELVLPRRPVLAVTSVTSVWPGGPAWAAGDLLPDLEAGIVAPAAPGFTFWYGPWDVVYACGRTEIPERFTHAAKEQLRHLWDTQRGAMPPSVLGGEEVFTATAGWSFSVPRRVLELLEQDMVPSA